MFEQIDKLSEKLNTESSGQITVDMQGEVLCVATSTCGMCAVLHT